MSIDNDGLIMTRPWTPISLDDWPAPGEEYVQRHLWQAAIETAKGLFFVLNLFCHGQCHNW